MIGTVSTGGVAGPVGGEERHEIGDLAVRPDPAQRVQRHLVFLGPAQDRLHQLGLDLPGCDADDPDTVTGPLQGEHPGQHDNFTDLLTL